jgi:hypothetical protein
MQAPFSYSKVATKVSARPGFVKGWLLRPLRFLRGLVMGPIDRLARAVDVGHVLDTATASVKISPRRAPGVSRTARRRTRSLRVACSILRTDKLNPFASLKHLT